MGFVQHLRSDPYATAAALSTTEWLADIFLSFVNKRNMKINECRATMNTSYEIDKTLLLYRAKSAKKKPTMHLYRYISYGLYKSLEYRESLHLQSTLSFRKDPSIPNNSSDVLGRPGRFDSSDLIFICAIKNSRLSSHFFFQ